jgi:hypothetical protein
MTDQPQQAVSPGIPPQEISQEFFIRVNDFIEMANRIERRFDVEHAQIAMLHAFSRFSAHHYLSKVKDDSAKERDDYGEYIGDAVKKLVLHYTGNLKALAAEAASAAPPADTAAE